MTDLISGAAGRRLPVASDSSSPVASSSSPPSRAPDEGPLAALGALARPTTQPSPMRREEVPLAAYLTARTALGRTIDAADASRLKDANTSLNETRQQLPHGRGNVASDLKATDGLNRWRVSAARAVAREISTARETAPQDRHNQTIHGAAAAIAFGAGNCGTYAHVAMVTHAARLKPQEEMHHVSSAVVDHSWAESRLGTERERAVVIDGWSEGSPVLAPDSHFAKLPPSYLLSQVTMAPDPLGTSKTHVDGLANDIRQQFGEEGLRQKVADQARPTARFAAWVDSVVRLDWTSQQVVDPAFAAEARQKMGKSALNDEIAAAGAARALGRPIAELKTDVPQILAATEQLLR